MDIHHLVTMANQIADFFKTSNPDRAEAVAATAQHLRSFWDPRMRREIIAHLASEGGEGLNEIARDAVRMLEGEASAKAAAAIQTTGAAAIKMPDDGNRIAESAERAASSESIRHHPARKFRDGRFELEDDRLAVEEPLEIRLGGRRFTLTMRTPGNDEELVAGFLLAEGFIESRADLGEIRRLRGPKGAPDPNAVDVILNVPAANLRERLKRNFTISSSCGVCGKTSIEATQRRIAPITSRMTVAAGAILELAPMMRRAQEVFAATGGLHAAALFVSIRCIGAS